MKKPPVLTGGFLLCLSCEHFPQSFEEMTVGHFQHTGDQPLLRPETVELLADRWEKDPEKILRQRR